MAQHFDEQLAKKRTIEGTNAQHFDVVRAASVEFGVDRFAVVRAYGNASTKTTE